MALGSTATVVLVVAAAPLASAGSAGLLFTAPYPGFVDLSSVAYPIAGCGIGKITHPASFSKARGVGILGVSARAPLCGSANTTNAGVASEDFIWHLPLNLTPGPHSIVTNWTLNGTLLSNETFGKCSKVPGNTVWGCDSEAFAAISARLQIGSIGGGRIYLSSSWAGVLSLSSRHVDCNRICHTWTNGSSGVSNQSSVALSVSWTVSGTIPNLRSPIHWGLLAGFTAEAFEECTAQTYVAHLTGCHGSASVQFQATLTSVLVS